MFDGGGDGQAEGGTGGGAEALGIIGVHRALEEGGSGGSEGLGGTDDGAGVTGVLDAIEDDDEGLASDELVESPRGRTHEGDDTLRGLGGGELLKGLVGDGDDARAFETAQMGRDDSLRGFGGDDDGDLAAAAQGFF